MNTITCIGCPMGCQLEIENAGPIKISGHQCKIGVEYGKEETVNPTRNIATSVKVDGGDIPMLSVKTSRPIPKSKIFDCVRAVQAIRMQAPINIGDVVLSNVANTGVDFVATRNILTLSKT